MSEFHKRIKTRLSARAKVILTLEQVQEGQSLAVLFDELLANVSETDRGFVHTLTLGVLRQWWALCRVSESLVDNPITDKGLLAGLNIGLYQLLYMQTPDYASIFDTVEAVKELDKGYGAGLVNAVLRKVANHPAKFSKKVNKNHSLPNWLAKTLKQDWGEHYDELGQVLRTSAPIFVRANTTKISHADYLAGLALTDIHAEPVQMTTTVFGQDERTDAIRLTGGQVATLPDFADGAVAVQDLHAQLSGAIIASLMTQFDKPLNLLDACTAPAGKLTHWLEILQNQQKDFTLTAIDNDERRLGRVFENIHRLGFGELLDKNLSVQTADATTFNSKKPFDVIMLDAPCSATGVIRRHPDISLLRTPDDILHIVQLQKEILDNLWLSLAEDGYLLYITCSILKAENEGQMVDFLARHKDARQVPLSGDWGLVQTVGRQCLPQVDGGDGFYYALLQKAV